MPTNKNFALCSEATSSLHPKVQYLLHCLRRPKFRNRVLFSQKFFLKIRHSNKSNFYNTCFENQVEHNIRIHTWTKQLDKHRILYYHLLAKALTIVVIYPKGLEPTSVCYCWPCAEKVWKIYKQWSKHSTIESKTTIVWL